MSVHLRSRVAVRALAALAALAGCSVAAPPREATSQGACTGCHGDQARAGTDLTKAAPPFGVRGGTSSADLDVGAHQAHLAGKAFSTGFPCQECHAEPGADHPSGRIEFAFSTVGNLAPATRYDAQSHTCATSACHDPLGEGRVSPAWTAGAIACGDCHALPPAPSTGHPAVSAALTGCALCHPETMKADGTLDVAGGHHVNGVVEATGHGDYASATTHGPKALDWLGGVPGALDCAGCHGATLDGGFGPSCNACHTAAGWTSWSTNCSFCHGQRSAGSKAGYAVASQPTWSAPPDAIAQRLDPSHAVVPDRTGAHLAHLTGATAGGLSFAAPFRCATCHAVPSDLSHVSGASARATVVLSGAGQAMLPASLGSYDPASTTCATACHGSAPSPAWSSTGLVCGSCHALPPAPATGHPVISADLTTCAVCHPATMKPDGTLDVAGGKHLDGVVEASGAHGDFLAPAIHGPKALDWLGGVPGALDCGRCHGATLDGGAGPSCNACHASAGWTSWKTNCSFCHGAVSAGSKSGYAVASHPTWSAPPDAVAQRLDPAHAAIPARIGAHQAHLTGATAAGLSFAAPFTCATCHAVPSDTSHIGGATSRATVVLSGAGQGSLPASLGSYDPAAGTCATACHGAAPSPAWSSTGLSCGGCHALPPSTASGHPAVASALTGCAACHPATMKADGTLDLAGGKHLDGLVEVTGGHPDWTSPPTHGPKALDWLGGVPGTLDCGSCHGATLDGGFGPSCNACHATAGWNSWQTNCSFCHGTKSALTRAGYAVASHPTWSAPPDAIAQRLDPAHAAVPARTGAHQAHLTGSTAGGVSFALPFSCATCHTVPTDLSHVGGAASRATVSLSGAGQASLPALLGTYDPATGACATACHGASPSPGWATSGLVCGGCHALPPAPSTGHPAVAGGRTACAGCHPETMKADGTLDVAGGKHVDGKVEVSGGHADWTAPATHGPKFFAFLREPEESLDCRSCHGATLDGGLGPSCNGCHASNGWTAAWQTNCSFCHGTRSPATMTTPYSVITSPTLSAPPDALSQRLTGVADPARTGAHQAHLTGKGSSSGALYAAPIACGTCHTVPADYRHAGGPGRAPVVLQGLTGSLPASLGTYSAASGTCTTYCHGSTLANPTPPTWSGGELGCTGCHGNPPVTGQHDYHVNQLGYWCADCHNKTVSYPPVSIGVKHLNGTPDVDFYEAYLPGTTYSGGNCSTVACHPFSYSASW